MGIDYGGKRVGIAFSDPTALLAFGSEVYVVKDEQTLIDHLLDKAKQRQVKKVVFGLPLNADGTESDFTKVVKNFAEKFQNACGLEVDFEDERFSSLEAEEILKERKIEPKKRKQILDQVAAEIILQNYLNKRGTK